MLRASFTLITILTTVPAFAGPIDQLQTTGKWSVLGTVPSNSGPRWFDNLSWDGPEEAVGWKHQDPGWLYLHADGDPNSPVGFGWLGPLPDSYTWEIGITDWLDGQLTHDPVSGG